jgi:putative transposase
MKPTSGSVERQLAKDGFPIKDVLTPILGPLVAKYHPDSRDRCFTPECVVFSMVSSILARDVALKACVIQINADRTNAGLKPVSINTAAYSDARSRLASEVLIQSAKLVAQNLEENVPLDPFWQGMRPFAIDGSTLTTEDTEANQAAFPQHGGQDEGIGFPILRVALLQSISTGAVHGFNFGAYKGKETGEMALARDLVATLPPGSLLLGDRYYPSFFMMAQLARAGVQGVFQSHAARDVDFRRGTQVGYGDHIVSWEKPPRPKWMSAAEYQDFPDSIMVREVDLTKELGRGERVVLVTTLQKVNCPNFTKKDGRLRLRCVTLKTRFNWIRSRRSRRRWWRK